MSKLMPQFQFLEQPVSNKRKLESELRSLEIPLQNGPFAVNEIRTCTFELPKQGPIGLLIEDDPLFHLPFIKDCCLHSIAYDSIPSTYQCNSFIININTEGPASATFAVSLIKAVQQTATHIIQLDLVK